MNDARHSQQRILEAIELFGRGRGETSDSACSRLADTLDGRPGLAELCERSKQLDEQLGDVFRDVPVPRGLEQRILDHLESAAELDVENGSLEVASTDEAVADRPRPARRGSSNRSSRRRWITAMSGTLAGCLLLAGGLFLLFWPSDECTVAQVLDAAEQRFVSGDIPPGEAISAEILALHPFGKEVRRLPRMRWRKVDGFLNRQGVAYEMSAAGGTRATLFVIPFKRTIDGLGPFAPGRPQRATGPMAVGAWQTGDVLYVLVVRGNARTYRQFLAQGGPIA